MHVHAKNKMYLSSEKEVAYESFTGRRRNGRSYQSCSRHYIHNKDHCPDAEFLYAGTPNGMESRLVPMENIPFAPIKVSGFQRKLTPKNIVRNIKAAAYLTTAGHTARKIIKDFGPDIVIGTGGYVSGPIVLEAEKWVSPLLSTSRTHTPELPQGYFPKRLI